MGRKLHRSATDKKPFGVCGGLSEYFNIDSSFFRIVFVLLTVCATLGIWIYLLLALFMTSDDGYTSPEYHSKERLVRIAEDKKILGVCAGYSEYFDIDVVSLRIIVILSTLIGFGPIFYVVSALFMPVGEKTSYESGEILFESDLYNEKSPDTNAEDGAKSNTEETTPALLKDAEPTEEKPKKRVCIRRVKRPKI